MPAVDGVIWRLPFLEKGWLRGEPPVIFAQPCDLAKMFLAVHNIVRAPDSKGFGNWDSGLVLTIAATKKLALGDALFFVLVLGGSGGMAKLRL